MTEQYRTREERRKAAEKKKKAVKPNKRRVGSLLKKVFLTCLAIAIIGIIAGGVTFFVYAKDAPPLDESLLRDPQSMKIYDMDNNKIADIGAQKRTYLDIDEIPDVVKDAVIATEDARFYKHHGIDPIRLGGAVIANITQGFGSEGASTISQQVVKNSFLSTKKTLERKAQEAWLAIQLERHYSKDKILEFYLNKILYGRNYYGIAKAAEVYLGLDKEHINDITLDQAALLAGIPQRPNYFNPFVHPEAAEKRRNVVLNLMAQHGYISMEQAEKAKAVPIEESIVKQPKEEVEQYDAFIDQVIKEVSDAVGSKEVGKVYKVYTTLDPDAQKYVENQLRSDENLQNKYPDNTNFQAGITLLDTGTGEIRAIGGGRNRQEGGWNYATDIRKQPGSTIKPILDYGPAIEYLKWSTYKQLDDEPYTYSGGTPINNWDHSYKGTRSMRYMLQWSRNIPALKALQAVGLEQAREFAVGLGIPLEEQIYEPYAIGGFRKGVSPLQMAGAYSAFGNNGIYNQPHTIRKIVFQDGTEKDLTPKPTMAMSDYTAFMITDMLRSVVDSGTGTLANVSGLDVAGKTGTTNYGEKTIQTFGLSSNAVPDSWFVGYTPNYTCAIWTGFEKVDENAELSAGDQKIARELFRNILENVSEGKDHKTFKQPKSVVQLAIERGSNPAMLAGKFTPKEKIIYEYFIRGNEPTAVSKKYRKLPSPTDFSALYDQELDQLTLSWKSPKNMEEADEIKFEVNQSIDGGTFTPLSTTNNLNLIIDKPSHGSVYVFQITTVDATNPERRSDSVNVEVEIPAEVIPNENEDENEDIDEGQDEENQNGNSGNESTDTEDLDGENGENSENDEIDPNNFPPTNNGNNHQDDQSNPNNHE